MYNETYDDYIRSILGYPPNSAYNNYEDFRNSTVNYSNSVENLEECYPEIYKIVYPMVTKRCSNVRGNLTNSDIESITDEIYYAIEEKNEIQLNINLNNQVRTTQANSSSKVTDKKVDTKISEVTGQKRETRQINRGLRDLIKILIIRELLNRPRPRPPMPGPGHGPGPRPPMRPPFGGPGRNPFNRDFEIDSNDIFEF